MTDTRTQASDGARAAAEKIVKNQWPYVKTFKEGGDTFKIRERWAALIDAELRELLPYTAHDRGCEGPINPNDCTCGLAALLERWRPR